MAIFHFSAKVVSRGAGQSVVAAAAYQSRSNLYNERDGLQKNYSRHGEQELLESGIYAPKGAPEWVFDRERLWNAAEHAEDQHNKTRAASAQTARHIELALPHELDLEQNRRLVQDFVRDNFTRKGYVADVNIHAADRGGDSRNIHAHIMVTMRKIDRDDFAAKKERLDKTEQRDQLQNWRENWARQQSRHLERAGFKMEAARMVYAHRTLEDQAKIAKARGDHDHAEALKREPTIHEGATATQMKREGKGEQSNIINFNEAAKARTEELRRMKAELWSLKDAEKTIYYARTPTGKMARLDRRHEWQRDKLEMKHAAEQYRQSREREWERHKNAQASPVVTEWRERELERQQVALEQKHAAERAELIQQQQDKRRFAAEFWKVQEYEKNQAKANLMQRPARNHYRQGVKTRLRNMDKSEAQREQEQAAARYYNRMKRDQREPTEEQQLNRDLQDELQKQRAADKEARIQATLAAYYAKQEAEKQQSEAKGRELVRKKKLE